ncbi:hypothetical protein LguiB_033360 [Lonicera macranthoides]
MDLFSIKTFLLPLILLFFSLYIFLKPKHKTTTITIKNGFKMYPILGTIPEFLLNRHRFLDWSTEILSRTPTNTAVFHRPGKIQGLITANPINVEHMLKTNFENYPKGPRFIEILEDFLGGGIFNSDGDLWKVQRKTASYEFNTKSLRNFVIDNVTVEAQTRLIPVLQKAAQSNRVLDLQDVLERFAFDNICKVAFNVDPGCLGGVLTNGGDFMRAFEEAATLSSARFMYAFPIMFRIKKMFNLGSEKRLQKSVLIVHEFADNIIQSRLQEGSNKKDEDLLSRFIGDNNSAEFLRDIIISFILAGRDTTSSALTWFFWLLSKEPKVKNKILKELKTVRYKIGKKPGENFGFDELREMHYLHAAISESLRLYPPVAIDTKECLEDDVMPDGTFVGKEWFVMYHAYAMGRMENIWGKDWSEFRPDRWIGDGGFEPENPFRFPVFHGGPRMCLGKDMAYIQMKSIVASVIERFEIDVQDKNTCPEHVLSLTLRMKNGLPVTVKERRVDKTNCDN